MEATNWWPMPFNVTNQSEWNNVRLITALMLISVNVDAHSQQLTDTNQTTWNVGHRINTNRFILLIQTCRIDIHSHNTH